MLDIIEDCLQFKGWYCYERIDTQTKENDKQLSISHFTNPDLNKKILLLST